MGLRLANRVVIVSTFVALAVAFTIVARADSSADQSTAAGLCENCSTSVDGVGSILGSPLNQRTVGLISGTNVVLQEDPIDQCEKIVNSDSCQGVYSEIQKNGGDPNQYKRHCGETTKEWAGIIVGTLLPVNTSERQQLHDDLIAYTRKKIQNTYNYFKLISANRRKQHECDNSLAEKEKLFSAFNAGRAKDLQVRMPSPDRLKLFSCGKINIYIQNESTRLYGRMLYNSGAKIKKVGDELPSDVATAAKTVFTKSIADLHKIGIKWECYNGVKQAELIAAVSVKVAQNGMTGGEAEEAKVIAGLELADNEKIVAGLTTAAVTENGAGDIAKVNEATTSRAKLFAEAASRYSKKHLNLLDNLVQRGVISEGDKDYLIRTGDKNRIWELQKDGKISEKETGQLLDAFAKLNAGTPAGPETVIKFTPRGSDQAINVIAQPRKSGIAWDTSDKMIALFDSSTKEPIATIDYSIVDGNLHVNMIRVQTKYQGRGYAELALRQLLATHPELKTFSAELAGTNSEILEKALQRKPLGEAVKKTPAYKSSVKLGFTDVKINVAHEHLYDGSTINTYELKGTKIAHEDSDDGGSVQTYIARLEHFQEHTAGTNETARDAAMRVSREISGKVNDALENVHLSASQAEKMKDELTDKFGDFFRIENKRTGAAVAIDEDKLRSTIVTCTTQTESNRCPDSITRGLCQFALTNSPGQIRGCVKAGIKSYFESSGSEIPPLAGAQKKLKNDIETAVARQEHSTRIAALRTDWERNTPSDLGLRGRKTTTLWSKQKLDEFMHSHMDDNFKLVGAGNAKEISQDANTLGGTSRLLEFKFEHYRVDVRVCTKTPCGRGAKVGEILAIYPTCGPDVYTVLQPILFLTAQGARNAEQGVRPLPCKN